MCLDYMALRGPSVRPRPKPTRSTVAPQKHNVTQRSKPVPRPVRKNHGPTQKSKPIPRGKPVPKHATKHATKPATKPVTKVEFKPRPKPKPRTRTQHRSPTRSQHRSPTRSPNRTVFAKLLSQLGLSARPPSPNGLPRSPNGIPPNPLHSPHSPPGLPSPGRSNPLHSHSPNFKKNQSTKSNPSINKSKRASNRTRVGTGF